MLYQTYVSGKKVPNTPFNWKLQILHIWMTQRPPRAKIYHLVHLLSTRGSIIYRLNSPFEWHTICVCCSQASIWFCQLSFSWILCILIFFFQTNNHLYNSCHFCYFLCNFVLCKGCFFHQKDIIPLYVSISHYVSSNISNKFQFFLLFKP